MGDNDTATTISDGKDMAAAHLGKEEPPKDGSSSSIASTPEQDPEPYPQEQSQTQKRKGGRKPIYATSEERKQRNRQAQAAFRERRTEYIKQLESTIKHHEETLQNLQASHRTAADECLMLRYKNSLLERILIEKGIDVQAELRAKTGSPNLGPTRVPQATAAPLAQPIQRYAVNKFHQSRRSLTGIPPPPKADGVTQAQSEGLLPTRSPLSQPTPTSHLSSPTAISNRSPNFLPQGGATSPSFGPIAQQGQQLRPQQPLRPQPTIHQSPQQLPTLNTTYSSSSGVSTASSGAGSGMTGSASASAGQSNYYPSPFQNHYDQLEQEYDAQAEMIDENDNGDQSAGPGPFPGPFSQPMPPQGMPPPMTTNQGQGQPFQPQVPVGQGDNNGTTFGGINQLFDPYDPMLDADPFGLSASMHFPTAFTFDNTTR